MNPNPNSLDNAFHQFVNWQTLLFCLGISILTHVIRTVVEALWKGAMANDLWNEFFVRLGPTGTGVWLVFAAKKFPWPTLIEGSWLAMGFYGAACGMASAYVYAAFRAWLTALGNNGSTVAQKLVPSKFPKAMSSHPPPPDTNPPPP